ncbi:7171_t:CDS:2 [Rhizophagus irregularis]|nr:7171_t:CDS:2 [Rhizophagus irregularis]
MEENDWVIEFGYDDIKSMFDPIVERSIKMIHMQLDNNRKTCTAMFLSKSCMERRRSNRKRRPSGRIHKFLNLTQRGTVVEINQEFTLMIFPISPTQGAFDFLIYYTANYSAQYIDEDGMEKFGNLLISLPNVHSG